MKNDIIKFLLGEGSIDGLNFGDEHPFERGKFWWRKYLRQGFFEQHNIEQKLNLHGVVRPTSDSSEGGELCGVDDDGWHCHLFEQGKLNSPCNAGCVMQR